MVPRVPNGTKFFDFYRSAGLGRLNLEVAQTLDQAFGRGVDFQYALDELLSVCRPTVRVATRSNHGARMFGYLTICIPRNFSQLSESQLKGEKCTHQHFR